MWNGLVVWIVLEFLAGVGFLKIQFLMMKKERGGEIPPAKSGVASTQFVALLTAVHFFFIFPAMTIWAYLADK